jgi:hypothetical protein
MDGWMDVYCERMVRKSIGQDKTEISLGIGHGPNWAIHSLAEVVD